MAKRYYTLLALYDTGWGVEFGDYDCEVVEQERADSWDQHEDPATKIIRTGDAQADIDAAVATLNVA